MPKLGERFVKQNKKEKVYTSEDLYRCTTY